MLSAAKHPSSHDAALIAPYPELVQRTRNLPVMSIRIHHAAHSPTVFLTHRNNLGCARLERPRKHSVRIRDGQNHPHRTAAQSLRAEIAILGRFVTQPELRAIHGKP